MKSRKSQSGFTLVEIAVVLVIIGLLLGAVLKGQELIENSRAKNAINEVSGIKSAHFGYIDRYKRTPGDDGPTTAALQTRGGTWTTITAAGNLNGVVAAPANFNPAANSEPTAYFQHLRAAGFITGDATATGQVALPRNAFGGLTNVVNAAVQGYPVATLQLCQGNVPGKAATTIDNQVDDGRPGTGSVRATQGVNNAAPGAVAANYNEAQTYTVCTAM